MNTEIIIRPAKPEDLEFFRALRLEALKNHPEAFGQDYFDIVTKDDAYWADRMQMNPMEDALFFAEADSHLVGMTGIHRRLIEKAKHSAMIWGVYVKPEYRGRHISERLISSCVGWAKKQNVSIVKLAVVATNIPAIRCYERCGFKSYGTEPKAIFYESVYHDEYLMSLEI